MWISPHLSFKGVWGQEHVSIRLWVMLCANRCWKYLAKGLQVSHHVSATREEPHADLSEAAALCIPTDLPPSPFLSIFIIHISFGPREEPQPTWRGAMMLQHAGVGSVMGLWLGDTFPRTPRRWSRAAGSVGAAWGLCGGSPPACPAAGARGAWRLIKENPPALGCLPDHRWHFCDWQTGKNIFIQGLSILKTGRRI